MLSHYQFLCYLTFSRYHTFCINENTNKLTYLTGLRDLIIYNEFQLSFKSLRGKGIITISMLNLSSMEFFLNGEELSLNSVISANSGNLVNHWSMNWAQFKDPVSHMCLAGAVIASWSFRQEVAGSSLLMTNIFCHWIRWMKWKHLGKTPMRCEKWNGKAQLKSTWDFHDKHTLPDLSDLRDINCHF